MARRPVDPVDTIWLNMDRANNLMVIDSLIMFEGPVDWERFLEVVQRRIVDRYPVFSQVPVPPRVPLGMPHWEDDEEFDVERQVVRAALPGPGGDTELQAYVNAHLSLPLDRDRPLWRMHLLDGYGAGSAVYCRFHHALADGIALTQVLLSMTDAAPDGDLLERDLPDRSRRGLLGQAAHLTGSALHEVPHLLRTDTVVDLFTLAQQTTGAASKLLLTRLPTSPLTGEPSQEKRAIWSPPIPLEDVKQIGRRTGTTVNDVLVSALAGAVSAYTARHHGAAVDLPTMVPVDVRPPDEPLPRNLGNRFALVLLILPSSLGTPFERLAETKRRMDVIKESPEAVLTFGLIQAIGRTGADIERYLVDFFANKASGVTTNVPGPQEPRYAAGTRISGLLGWVPESGQQTLGTSIFTYNGQVRVGFKVDVAHIPEPEELLEQFQEELEALMAFAHTP